MRRRLRKPIKIALQIFLIVFVFVLFVLTLKTVFSKPENINHQKYKDGKCLVYYPNNEKIEEYAKNLCVNKDKQTIDFNTNSAGDYFLIEYPEKTFYLNNDYSDINLIINDRQIVLDELVYQMKKDNQDIAYTSSFISNISETDLDNSSLSIENNELLIYVPQYDYSLHIPLDLAQNVLNMNFGLNKIEYTKRRYVNPNKPMLAITYDDGPYKPVDTVIIDTFLKYDSRCTFFFVGDRMGPNSLAYSKDAINEGFEIGSHSEHHAHLAKLSASDAKASINQIVDYFKENANYDMKVYRPPYGERNIDMEENIDLVSILWNVDSQDWKNRDSDITYSNIMKTIDENDVVLMHSLYESSANATKKLVPDLIDQGYQLVTISELLENLNLTDKKVFRGN